MMNLTEAIAFLRDIRYNQYWPSKPQRQLDQIIEALELINTKDTVEGERRIPQFLGDIDN